MMINLLIKHSKPMCSFLMNGKTKVLWENGTKPTRLGSFKIDFDTHYLKSSRKMGIDGRNRKL
jgi:hypothetical protein